MTEVSQFENQRFLTLETFRKNGTPVPTPVGFVKEGTSFYIRTQADAGKLKRIRNNNRVRIVPSTPRGEPLGTWIDATAEILDDAESARVRTLILAQYGLIWRIIELVNNVNSLLRGKGTAKWVSIRLTPTEG